MKSDMRLVLVDWLDAVGGVQSGWRPLSDIKKKAKAENARSVGWLITDNDDVIVVCPHLVGDGEPDGDGEITIPKSWVSKITEIGPKRAKR